MIIIGTRGSALALAQTAWIKDLINRQYPAAEVEVKVIKTSADKDQITSLRSASTVGVFVKELEQALLAGDIDLAVHSMKDLPTQIPSGLRITAIPEREDAHDALITNKGISLFDLPVGSRVGTGSIRRQAQILASRSDLKITDIRGNVDTRLKKLQNGDCDAIILACAGLRRLGLQHRITAALDFRQMLPAPGQGALAIETRADDQATEVIAASLNHPTTALAVMAERHFLERMGGGCNVPVAVYAQVAGNTLEIDGLVASPDGRKVVRDSMRQRLQKANEAADLLAERILSRGGRAILDETP